MDVELPEGRNLATLSHGHGWLSQCDSVTGWSETEDGNVGAMTVQYGYYFDITIASSGGNKVYYQELDMTNISSTTYPKIRFRYRTSSTTIKAKIVLVFTSGTQTVLDETSTDSANWTVGTEDITEAKTIDKIQIYANQDTGAVHYEFLLIYAGDFTLPNIAYGMTFDPNPTTNLLKVPGRVVNITQHGGADSAEFTLGCDLTQGTWTRSGDTIDGEVFIEIAHQNTAEPWQWFDSGSHQLKVTVHPRWSWSKVGNATGRRLDVTLREYALGDMYRENWQERFGIGL